MGLTQQQHQRYNRQIALSPVGREGQKRILKSKVLIIGVGGLGSSAALYLTAAGVGSLGIVDSDAVELSNLARQIIHYTSDIGISKAQSAKTKLRALNPDIAITPLHEKVTPSNITTLIADYDFILDCTDTFSSKYLINDACVAAQKAFSHASVLGFDAQLLTYTPGSACYRCAFKKPQESDAIPTTKEIGVLGSLAGMIGTIQATEALKYIAGAGKLLVNRLLTIDALEMDMRVLMTKKDLQCSVCGLGA